MLWEEPLETALTHTGTQSFDPATGAFKSKKGPDGGKLVLKGNYTPTALVLAPSTLPAWYTESKEVRGASSAHEMAPVQRAARNDGPASLCGATGAATAGWLLQRVHTFITHCGWDTWSDPCCVHMLTYWNAVCVDQRHRCTLRCACHSKRHSWSFFCCWQRSRGWRQDTTGFQYVFNQPRSPMFESFYHTCRRPADTVLKLKTVKNTVRTDTALAWLHISSLKSFHNNY